AADVLVRGVHSSAVYAHGDAGGKRHGDFLALWNYLWWGMRGHLRPWHHRVADRDRSGGVGVCRMERRGVQRHWHLHGYGQRGDDRHRNIRAGLRHVDRDFARLGRRGRDEWSRRDHLRVELLGELQRWGDGDADGHAGDPGAVQGLGRSVQRRGDDVHAHDERQSFGDGNVLHGLHGRHVRRSLTSWDTNQSSPFHRASPGNKYYAARHEPELAQHRPCARRWQHGGGHPHEHAPAGAQPRTCRPRDRDRGPAPERDPSFHPRAGVGRVVPPSVWSNFCKCVDNGPHAGIESRHRPFVPFEEAAMLLHRVLRTLPWTVCLLVWAAGPPLAFGLTFTDDPLVPRTTTVKVVQITELRSDIDTVRTRLGLDAFSWTDPTLIAHVTPIKRMHVIDVRTALDEAYQKAGKPLPTYSDATIVVGQTVVKVSHLND